MLRATYRGAKRLVVFGLGCTLLVIGLALVFLPGPGIPIIFLGLILLGTEFVWARQWLRRLRVVTHRTGRRVRTWGSRAPPVLRDRNDQSNRRSRRAEAHL